MGDAFFLVQIHLFNLERVFRLTAKTFKNALWSSAPSTTETVGGRPRPDARQRSVRLAFTGQRRAAQVHLSNLGDYHCTQLRPHLNVPICRPIRLPAARRPFETRSAASSSTTDFAWPGDFPVRFSASRSSCIAHVVASRFKDGRQTPPSLAIPATAPALPLAGHPAAHPVRPASPAPLARRRTTLRCFQKSLGGRSVTA